MAPKGAQPPPGPASSHGLTPPMRDARRRHFRQRIEAPPHVVTRVEADLLAIIRVRGEFGAFHHDHDPFLPCRLASNHLFCGLFVINPSCYSGLDVAMFSASWRHLMLCREDVCTHRGPTLFNVAAATVPGLRLHLCRALILGGWR